MGILVTRYVVKSMQTEHCSANTALYKHGRLDLVAAGLYIEVNIMGT